MSEENTETPQVPESAETPAEATDTTTPAETADTPTPTPAETADTPTPAEAEQAAPTPASVPRPGPRPTPAAVPHRPAATATTVHPVATAADLEHARRFGRVAEDGTVFVRTSDDERPIGSYPGATADEALTYFARKYDEIVAQVELFEQRLAAADVPTSEIDSGLAKLREATSDVHAVGDLAALEGKVAALVPVAAKRRAEVEAARVQARDEARTRRTALVEEAEKISEVPAEKTQWRSEGQRMKDLFELWRTEQKSGVRLDRRSEDELWKRFSHARTAFDRKRRQHFAHLDEQQAEAKGAKQALVKEAEAMQSSTDWGATAAAYKRLMDRWRAAGRANRKDDDDLWGRFRAAQDTFFAARHAEQAEQDAEFTANLAVKQALLTEAEALLPVKDLAAAKRSLRDVQDRWEAAGKVPRGDVDGIERRMRTVEQAVREGEDARWQSSNPEARARAQSAVDQLETGIADLESELARARDQGKAKRAADAEASLAARREWLEQARRALTDFGG